MDAVNRNELATIPQPTRLDFTDREIELIKATVLAGQQVTDAEFAVFLRAAEHTGLDPLMKQIYGIKRQGRLTIQTGIDGYRLIAARSGEMAGSDAPVYGDVILGEGVGGEYPEWASVTVWRYDRHSVRQPYVGLAYWNEFYPGEGGPGTMWRKMPRKMLGKCAEAEALRKAFPAELAGTYTVDEMTQAGQDDPLRPYRDDLIARARALPDQARAELRRTGIDPRTADAGDLRRFEAELAALEDAEDGTVDAELVEDPPGDDGDGPGRTSGSHPSGPENPPAPAAGDGPGDPASPGPTNRQARYAVEKTARARSTVAMQHTLDAARYDDSPLDLATRAGLKD